MPRPKKVYSTTPLAKLTMKRDHDDLLDRLRDMFVLAKDDKEEWQNRANRFYKAYMGEQWVYPDTAEPLPIKSWQDATVRNHLFATINSFKATMTDNRPRIYCVPRKPEDEELSDDMSQVIDYVWQVANMDVNIINVLPHSLICGIGFLKPFWDINRKDISIAVIDPKDIFIDPYAPPTNPIQGAKYVVQRFEIDTEEIDHLYPKQIDKIIASGSGDFDALESSNRGYRKVGRSILSEELDKYTGYEFWIKDYTEIPITHNPSDLEAQTPLSLEDYAQEGEEFIPLFPKGRVITVIGNQIVRDDDENPFKHGRVPIVEFIDHYVPNEIWPMGEIEQLIEPQIYVNDLLSQILSNLKLMGNSQWIAEKGVADINKITKEPGLIITTERGGMGKIRKEPGVPIPPQIYQMLLDTEASMQKISGLSDYSTGKRPLGMTHTSGIAIASVQEAAQAPIRMKVRNMENSLIELGMQLLGLIQQFYEPGRYIPLLSNGGMTHILLSEKHTQTEFTIQVESGSTLPVNKIDKANQVLNIYDRLLQLSTQQLIPLTPEQLTRWLLETINIPGTYPLIALMKRASSGQMAQMPMNQQQMGQGSGMSLASTPPLTQGGVPMGEMMESPMPEEGAGGMTPEEEAI